MFRTPALRAALVFLTFNLVTQAHPQSTVLVTSGIEAVASTSTTGGSTKVGNTVLGTAGTSTSTYEHSEVWEVVRRFSTECPAATFVINPATPHTMTVHTDYEKVGSVVLGKVTLYQLSLLDEFNNPIFVTKKNYLYREIKPICKIIEQRTKSTK